MLRPVKKSIKTIATWNRFIEAELALKQLERALKNGVKTQIITSKTACETQLPILLQPFQKTSLLQIKYFANSRPTEFIMIDDKKVLILCSEKTRFAETTYFVTDCPELLKLVSQYFEDLWRTAHTVQNFFAPHSA